MRYSRFSYTLQAATQPSFACLWQGCLKGGSRTRGDPHLSPSNGHGALGIPLPMARAGHFCSFPTVLQLLMPGGLFCPAKAENLIITHSPQKHPGGASTPAPGGAGNQFPRDPGIWLPGVSVSRPLQLRPRRAAQSCPTGARSAPEVPGGLGPAPGG